MHHLQFATFRHQLLNHDPAECDQRSLPVFVGQHQPKPIR